jgi:hypothetical protein
MIRNGALRSDMTTKIRPIVIVAALVGMAAPVMAQSANRSGPGVPLRPATAKTHLMAEPEGVSRCRSHCNALVLAKWHVSAPPQSLVEREARESSCIKEMAK